MHSKHLASKQKLWGPVITHFPSHKERARCSLFELNRRKALKPAAAASPCSEMTLQRLFLKAAISCSSFTLELSCPDFPALPGGLQQLLKESEKQQHGSGFSTLHKPSQDLIRHTHTHECLFCWHHTGAHMHRVAPCISVGWGQAISAAGLGHSQ